MNSASTCSAVVLPSVDKRVKASRKFVTELVEVARGGVIVFAWSLVGPGERRDLAQRARDAGKRACAVFGFAVIGGRNHLEHAVDRIHVAFGCGHEALRECRALFG
jgi:hypothetical protein